jgi:hypothetical protein
VRQIVAQIAANFCRTGFVVGLRDNGIREPALVRTTATLRRSKKSPRNLAKWCRDVVQVPRAKPCFVRVSAGT